MLPSIGIAVTTYRRNDVLANTLRTIDLMSPDVPLFVVDDGSPHPYQRVTHRLPHSGVSVAKNKCLELMYDAGIEHMFLLDDDVAPITSDWWKSYVEDPLPHLMLCWGRSRLISRDQQYTYWSHPRGVMLYVHRSVVDRVGGMRPEFAEAMGGEHVEWSRRIYNAGFTPSPFVDLKDSRNYWLAEDWGRTGETNEMLSARRADHTSFDRPARSATKHLRHSLVARYHDSDEFVEFRDRSDRI